MKRTFVASFLLLLAACDGPGEQALIGPAVHELAQQGETRRLLQRISADGDVNHRDICYRTPLMLAAQYGHIDTVNELIAAGARVDLHEKGYYTALMLAAGNGHGPVVRRLADAGARVNEVELTRGWTALIWAAKRGHTDTVRTLIELGADPQVRDAMGRSALDWARANRHTAVIGLLTSS
jgi:ankyrin repeat protein